MDLHIEVTGLDQLRARYRRAPQLIQGELTTSMTKVVIQGEAISRKMAPRWRGQLARSITHKVAASGSGVQGEWGTNLSYAKYKEFGTSRHFVSAAHIGAWAAAHGFGNTGIIVSGRAQPFMHPAFLQMTGPIRAEFRAAMSRIVAKLSAG